MSEAKPARVASVDGLRGLLAAYVVWTHMFNAGGDGRFIGLATVAVYIFFAISGYVLTLGWRSHFAGFLVRRFVRLWPLYALCVAVGGWLTAQPAPLSYYVWYPLPASSADIPQDPVIWSLFVEAWAMPFMPLILWLGRRPRAMLPVLGLLILSRIWFNYPYYGVFFIVGSHLADRKLESKWLDSAPVQWLGRISYSLYLSHELTIGVMQYQLPTLWVYLAVPAALAVAHLLYLTVEVPSIALSRRAGRWVEKLTAGLAIAAPAAANAPASRTYREAA